MGVALDGHVFEMALPSEVALAHLMPDVLAALQADSAHLRPRRVDGTWLDLERSLGDQGCTSGGVLCLELPEAEHRGRLHDPIAEMVERGPPVPLIADAAVTTAIGAAGATALVVAVQGSGPVLVALAPCAWALLPLLYGMVRAADDRRLRRTLSGLAHLAGSGALAASSEVAAQGWAGIALDGCVVLTVLTHVLRRRSVDALQRVLLGLVEWSSLVAVLPLMCVAAGWSHG